MPQSKLLLACCAALALYGQTSPAPTPPNTAEDILHRALVSLDQSDTLRTLYTYREFTEERTLDGSGRPKDRHTRLEDVLYLGERRYEHLLQKDGKPLEGATARREEQRMQRAVADAEKLTPEQRAVIRAKAERERRENNEFWKYVPVAYNIRQAADEAVSGRPAYVLLLTPKSGYNGKYAGFLKRIQARVYVDKQENRLARLDADIFEDVSLGLFIARIGKGTHMTFELARVNDEVWLPKLLDVQGSMRLLLKSIRGEEKTTFSDYRKYQADSRIIATAVP